MKRTTTLFWTCIFALAMLACGGGNNNPGNDGVDPDLANDNGSEVDVVDNDCTTCAEADVAGDEQTAPDNDTPDVQPVDTTMVCDENDVCCNQFKCCEGTNCWALGQDVVDEESTPLPDGSETETTVECYGDDYCDATSWCDYPNKVCRPDSLLEPYKWLEGDWKCLQGCGVIGQLYPLKLKSWDDATESVRTQGLICFLTFKYDGDTLLATATPGEPGTCFNVNFDNVSHQISMDEDAEGQYHWVFEPVATE